MWRQEEMLCLTGYLSPPGFYLLFGLLISNMRALNWHWQIVIIWWFHFCFSQLGNNSYWANYVFKLDIQFHFLNTVYMLKFFEQIDWYWGYHVNGCHSSCQTFSSLVWPCQQGIARAQTDFGLLKLAQFSTFLGYFTWKVMEWWKDLWWWMEGWKDLWWKDERMYNGGWRELRIVCGSIIDSTLITKERITSPDYPFL